MNTVDICSKKLKCSFFFQALFKQKLSNFAQVLTSVSIVPSETTFMGHVLYLIIPLLWVLPVSKGTGGDKVKTKRMFGRRPIFSINIKASPTPTPFPSPLPPAKTKQEELHNPNHQTFLEFLGDEIDLCCYGKLFVQPVHLMGSFSDSAELHMCLV